MDDCSNEYKDYYSTLKGKYVPKNKKKSKFRNVMGIFTYQLIFALVLTLGAYVLKITDVQKSKDVLAFVKENIYFKGVLPPYIENWYEK